MIRQITTRLVHQFAVQNRTQNFFDMNPIMPDFGDKNFDIYNSQRKKINVLDEYKKTEERMIFKQRLVETKLFTPRFQKYRRYIRSKKLGTDKSTYLAVGLDSDYDDFIKIYKRYMFMDTTARSEFKETLLKLIYQFKCKSQVELIKLFRISIAQSRKKDLTEKIRAKILQDVVLASSAELAKQWEQSQEGKKDIQEKAFKEALKEIDEKINKAEESLRYDSRGFPKILSNYDHKYGWLEQKTVTELDKETYDIQANPNKRYKITFPSGPKDGNIQDWSIKSRISRLYFLRRIEYIKQQKPQLNQFDLQFQQQLPINIRNKQKILNQLAHMYKADQLIQVPDLQEIYRDIDAMIDKVYVKVHSGSSTHPHVNSKVESKDQIYDRNPEPQEFMWENISAEEILCDTMYGEDKTKDIVLNDDAFSASPSSHTELTLSKIPINLFRHSELESFGVFNEYRKKLGTNVLRLEEIDFEPTFEEFSLESAKKKYRKFKAKIHTVAKVSKGNARRKTSTARALVKEGTGLVLVNGRPIQDYFGDTYHRVEALKPLVITDSSGLYDVNFRVFGGGQKGQGECMGYALARALIKINPEHKRVLAGMGFVGFDFRKKEPKKTNLYSARVRPPYVRR